MNKKEEFVSTTEYIKHKYKQYNIKQKSKDNSFGHTWWDGVSIEENKVPQCQTCKKDNDNFKLYKDTLILFESHSSINKSKDKTQRMQCSKS